MHWLIHPYRGLRAAGRRLMPVIVLCSAAAAPSPASAQHEALDAALARNSGLLGVQLMLAGQPRGPRMLTNAAERGDRLAQYNLGVAYAQGYISGRPAPEPALRWYRRAAEQGYASAAYNAGVLFANGEMGAVDMQRAAFWMRRAVELGHARAARWLARSRGAAESALADVCRGSSANQYRSRVCKNERP